MLTVVIKDVVGKTTGVDNYEDVGNTVDEVLGTDLVLTGERGAITMASLPRGMGNWFSVGPELAAGPGGRNNLDTVATDDEL